MASTEGLVPITRTFLATYYDKYVFTPLSESVSSLSDELRSIAQVLQDQIPLSEGEISLLHEVESQPPHKIDANMWKNREQMEEILFLLERSHWPNEIQQQSTNEDAELASSLGKLKDKIENTLKILESFQTKNSEFVFNTVMTYMPQDFRGTLIKQQRERSERNKQAEIDALVQSGASIHDRYALLWSQQMERRKQLAQLGAATGVYKTLVKYLVGVPQVLLDFIRQLNDDQGPMEEQRQRYGPPLYSLTKLVLCIRFFLSLSWRRYEAIKLQKSRASILEEAVAIYTSELERFLDFIGVVFMNSPFFITAEEAGAIEAGKNEDYKEIIIPSGKTYEVNLTVESVNSYIAWDFTIVQGKMNMTNKGGSDLLSQHCARAVSYDNDIGFSVEYTNSSGDKSLMLPYRRYEGDQGNFCTCLVGSYKLVWDNSYSTFFKKVLRYKVDCVPPVAEPLTSGSEEQSAEL